MPYYTNDQDTFWGKCPETEKERLRKWAVDNIDVIEQAIADAGFEPEQNNELLIEQLVNTYGIDFVLEMEKGLR